MKIPKEVGRIYKPVDIWGWFMCIFGVILMCKFGGVGWIFGTDKNWWLFALTIYLFWEYVCRVAFGRVYRLVFYDTLIHNMYIIETDDKTIYVNADSEDELDLYMEAHYPGMKYKIIDKTHTESFIREDHYC